MKHKLEILVNTNDIHILIPTYNRIDQIKKTINSVINQTYQGWLLTIIDNNSSDNTVDILNYEYKDLIKKKKIIIKPFRNFVNQAKNWNRCIEYVGNYRYFKLLCSDDVLDKNFLLIAKEKLDPTDASVAGFSSDINYININDEYIGSRSYGFFGLELWVSIFYRNYIGTPSSQLLKTNLFKNSEYILIPYCGDLLYLVDYCYSKNKKFVFHNSPLVNFRLWQDSDSFKLYGEKSMIDGRSRGRKMMIKKIFKKKTASVFFIAVSNSLFYIETIFFGIIIFFKYLKKNKTNLILLLKDNILPVRFIAVGLINTIFGYGIYWALLKLGFYFTIAALFSTLLGIIFNFFTLGRLVFNSTNNALFCRFVFVYIFLYFVSIAGISFIHNFDISYEISGGIMIIPSAIISFVLNKNLVFKK